MFRIHNLKEIIFGGRKPIVGISSADEPDQKPVYSPPKLFDFLPQKDRQGECVF